MKTAGGLVLATLVVAVYGLGVPSEFQKCKRSDPAINECLKSAVQDAFSVMAKGLPEFNFESIDPIRIPSMTIREGEGPVNVVQNYKNVEIHNIPLGKVENVKSVMTDDKFKLEIDMFIDDVHMNGQYNINGKILLMPISGEGDFTIAMKDVKAKLVFVGEMFEKKERTYVEIKTASVSLDVALESYNFENLFNGDATLGAEMNKILNENWTEISMDVRPGYEEAMAEIFKSLANLIFKKIPYDEMF